VKFIILFGPLAVGKMTVGQELEKLTGLKLFHNHLTIELVLPFFDMHTASFKKLVSSYRIQLFEEVAKSNLPGLIFTYVWELDQKKDNDFIDHIVKIFEKENASIYYIELEADAEERIRRNKSANRLKHKPSKRNFKASEQELLETDRDHILNSSANEFQNKNYFKINSTNLTANETARMVKRRFDL